MKYRKLYFFKISILLIFTFSCEFELNEKNFVEIDKPSETNMFTLSLNSNEDTIKVFNDIEFTYNVNTFGLDILSGEFTIEEKSWNLYSETGGFTVSPFDFEPGYHTLKLSLYTNSGSGSISDISGTEGYLVEKEWTLIIDSRPAPALKTYYSITPEGYLKLTWNKCDQYNFEYYKFYSSSVLQKQIFCKDSTSYIDSMYIGKSKSFQVYSYVKTDINSSAWGERLVIDDHYPKIHIEEKGVDGLRIYWNKSVYNVKYQLTNYSNSLGLGFLTDTTITIEQPGFGTSETYTLYTYPTELNEYDYKYVAESDSNYYLGDKFNGSWFYAYNALSKVIYTNRNNDLECYNISDLTLANSLYISYLQYMDTYACNTNSDKVAVMSKKTGLTDEIIYVYDDHTFQNLTILPFDMGLVNYSIDHFYLTDNNIVAVACSSKYELISVNTQTSLGTLEIDDYPYYRRWACFSTSKDGKYMCYVTLNGLYLYNIENGVFNLIYNDNRSYRSVLFDKNNPELFYVTFNGNEIMETRNVNAFDLVNTITLESKSQVIQNIDPETSYMLLTDYSYIYLKDINNSELKIKIKSSGYAPKIFDNKLFSENGYIIDITNYL